jgi:acetyltransferase-like isoleucine patch superfamily enzyme
MIEEPVRAPFIHSLADCQSTNIGSGTKIWQFTIVLPGAVLGSGCNINSHCFIENDVVIGNNCTVKCGVYIWDGVHIEDDVFVGPNVTFTNDKLPRSKVYPDHFPRTTIRRGASIGAGAIILPAIEVGEAAVIGAGALVTKNVPPRAVVIGSPARVQRFVS